MKLKDTRDKCPKEKEEEKKKMRHPSAFHAEGQKEELAQEGKPSASSAHYKGVQTVKNGYLRLVGEKPQLCLHPLFTDSV